MEQPTPRWRPGLVVLGVLLVAAWVSAHELSGGLQVRFRRPFTYIGAGEHMFWLAHAALLLPGLAAIGWGAGPLTTRVAERVSGWLTDLPKRRAIIGLVGVALVGVVAYRLGHLFFLSDLPFTDDEHAARFGGQVLASGELLTRLPAPEAVPQVYLFFNDAGQVTGMDWLGLLMTWAVAEFTGAGAWVFALWAAVPLVALPLAAGRAWGRTAAVAALFLVVLSPMAFSLSLTTHAHVVSRGALSIALCAYVFGRSSERRVPWIIAGLALGFGLITRPIETATLVAPLGLWELWQAARGDLRARRAVALIMPGLVIAGALFVAYNLATTGEPLRPPRFSSSGNLEKIASETSGLERLWERFGLNFSFNVLMLGVYFLGPLGIVAGIAGSADPLSRRLLAGVGLGLLVALAHDNTGVHAVGPIHYSETFAPLALVAACGVQRLSLWRGAYRSQIWATAVFVAGVGYAGFDLHQAKGLSAQAQVQAEIYAPFDDPAFPRSVVLAQQYGRIWLANPAHRALGTWVFDWRRPDPRGTDNVVFLHDVPGREASSLAAYPDRAAFRLSLTDAPPYMKLTQLR